MFPRLILSPDIFVRKWVCSDNNFSGRVFGRRSALFRTLNCLIISERTMPFEESGCCQASDQKVVFFAKASSTFLDRKKKIHMIFVEHPECTSQKRSFCCQIQNKLQCVPVQRLYKLVLSLPWRTPVNSPSLLREFPRVCRVFVSTDLRNLWAFQRFGRGSTFALLFMLLRLVLKGDAAENGNHGRIPPPNFFLQAFSNRDSGSSRPPKGKNWTCFFRPPQQKNGQQNQVWCLGKHLQSEQLLTFSKLAKPQISAWFGSAVYWFSGVRKNVSSYELMILRLSALNKLPTWRYLFLLCDR